MASGDHLGLHNILSLLVKKSIFRYGARRLPWISILCYIKMHKLYKNWVLHTRQPLKKNFVHCSIMNIYFKRWIFKMTSDGHLRFVYSGTSQMDSAYEKKRIHHWCQVGTGKSQPMGPPFQWETLERWTRGLGFPGSTVHQWSILFLTYPIKTYFLLFIWRGTVVYLWRRPVKYVTLEVTSTVLKRF